MTDFAELTDEILAFKHYQQAERGMAENTVISYAHDLQRYADWFAGGQMRNFRKPTLGELADYIAFMRDEKLAPASMARHLVSLKMMLPVHRVVLLRLLQLSDIRSYRLLLRCMILLLIRR